VTTGLEERQARGLRLFYAVLDAVALSFDHDAFSVVQQSIKNRSGDGRVVVEDASPMLGRQIGSEEDGDAFHADSCRRFLQVPSPDVACPGRLHLWKGHWHWSFESSD
jgi:hypothetical protein